MPEKAQDGFAKAFLPGLVLGIVVGSVVTAFVMPMLDSRPPLDDAGHATNPNPREDRGEPTILDEAQDTIQDAAGDTGEEIEDAADAIGDAIDDGVDGATEAIDNVTGRGG